MTCYGGADGPSMTLILMGARDRQMIWTNRSLLSWFNALFSIEYLGSQPVPGTHDNKHEFGMLLSDVVQLSRGFFFFCILIGWHHLRSYL